MEFLVAKWWVWLIVFAACSLFMVIAWCVAPQKAMDAYEPNIIKRLFFRAGSVMFMTVVWLISFVLFVITLFARFSL